MLDFPRVGGQTAPPAPSSAVSLISQKMYNKEEEKGEEEEAAASH